MRRCKLNNKKVKVIDKGKRRLSLVNASKCKLKKNKVRVIRKEKVKVSEVSVNRHKLMKKKDIKFLYYQCINLFSP